MNVLIFGASGGIGKWAIHYAIQNGHQVTAYVRHPEKMQIADDHLTIMQGELTDKEKITRALSGQDAVIWCVGIPMKRSYPGMNSLEGHRVLIQAMKEQGVKRLIDWGIHYLFIVSWVSKGGYPVVCHGLKQNGQ